MSLIRIKFNLLIIAVVIISGTFVNGQTKYEKARELMVKVQLREKGITDQKVLTAMEKVQRHRFVPKEFVSVAYEDRALPIGEDQTISKPSLVGLMTQALNLKHTSKVLEVGTGSGYQAAVLAEICDSVFSIEIVDRLSKKARRNLRQLKYSNVKLKIGDGYKGWEKYAPYDRIIVTCAPSRIPAELIHQLAEGGIMIIPLGTPSFQRLVLFEKRNGEMIEKTIASVQLDGMVGKKRRKFIQY